MQIFFTCVGSAIFFQRGNLGNKVVSSLSFFFASAIIDHI